MIKSEQKKRDEKIIKAYFGKEKVKFIALDNGLDTARIYQIWKENGLDPKKRFG